MFQFINTPKTFQFFLIPNPKKKTLQYRVFKQICFVFG